MRKALVLVLAALLAVSLLAGCTPSESTPAPAETPTPAAPANAATPTPQAADPAVDPGAPRELTIAAARFAQHVDWDQMYVWQQFEQDTGIKVNWVYLPGSTSALEEKRNLMVSTGELYDAFYGCKWKPAEFGRYADDGIFVPIQDYLDEYAPNTTKIYNEQPDIKNAVIMADGNIYGFPIIRMTKDTYTSMFLRTAWLDELNLERPKTPEDIKNILLAFKAKDPSRLVYTDYEDQPAYSGFIGTLMGAWGLGNRGNDTEYGFDIDPDTGELRYYRTDPKFKELLTMLHELYAAGCIDPDSLTQDEVAWGAKVAQNDPATIGCATNDTLRVYMCEMDYEGTGVLEGPYGDKIWASARRQVARPYNFVITSACENVPLAVEFADYWMDNGPHAEMFFWGQEGVNFEWDGDMRKHTEAMTNDPQGRSLDQMEATYTSRPGGMYFGTVVENPPDLSYNDVVANEMVRPYLPEVVWPNMNLTIDEIRISSDIGENIKTYYEESVVAFVSGKMSLDRDWDTYVKTINDMGLEQLTQVQQAWYDRYLASGGK